MQFFKRQLPIIIAFVAGMLMWARYYVPTPGSQQLQDDFVLWVRIIVGFAAILGIFSLLHHHWTKIKLKKPGFGFSWVTMFAFVVMSLAGFLPWNFPGFAEAQMPNSGSLFQWLFDNMFVPMQATMFSILAFFIASAAFRAFRARSLEATALLIAGCIVMIGRVPVGDLLADNVYHFAVLGNDYSILDFPKVSSWLLNFPNSAAQRGIILGIILSQVAISIRIIFGIERTYMGGGK